MIIKRIESDSLTDFKAFSAVILPLVNYLVFGGKN